MTTGSLCLTEILKSWKSCSSKSEASHTADSTRASGVALPYFSMTRLSSDPALTPMRIEVPWSLAAWAISLIWSSNFLMLPGLTRTAAQPASIAANTYFGWKWMSAITGICDLPAMAGSASASSWLGHATRTMSQPDAVSSAICCSVALMSVVGVVVIDCTDTGASPPTSTLPTLIFRLTRRGATTGGGSGGIPRETDMEPSVRGRARSAMIEPVQTRDDRDRALADDAEAARLRTQLGGLRHEADSARVDLEAMRERHRVEAEDVERLEGFGLTAVLSAVRGTRTGALDRERAEEVAARYAAQGALARLQSVESRREDVDRRLAQLGDTAARR